MKTDVYLFRQSPVDYVGDTIDLADNFCDSAIEILKSDNVRIFPIAGYLAAHAAELYMKAFLIASNPSKTLYNRFRSIEPRHDLIKILNLVKEIDPGANVFVSKMSSLNKYSGDKVRFAEYSYDPSSPKDYGTDEIWPIMQVRSYFRVKVYK